MRQPKRIVALLLSILMLFPVQSMAAWTDVNSAQPVIIEDDKTEIETEAKTEAETEAETEAGETTTEEGQDGGRISETLPIDPIEKEPLYLYWNPGGNLPEELASPSNAEKKDHGSSDLEVPGGGSATPSNSSTRVVSNAKKGSDKADGLTPQTPVKTLAAAVEKAQQHQEEGGIAADITIYVMNPLEVKDGELYILNAGGMKLKSWPERLYQSDTLFYINGGQLTLMNAVLETGRNAGEAELIYVRGGSLQLGKNVTIEEQIVMDYRRKMEEPEWDEYDTASASDATAESEVLAESDKSPKEGAEKIEERIEETLPIEPIEDSSSDKDAFNIYNYIISDDEESMELLEDKTTKSTWRSPVIELMEGFDGISESYHLEIRSDARDKEFDLVKTLYADDVSEDEFLEYFVVVDEDDIRWSLEAVSETEVLVRNTDSLAMTEYVMSLLDDAETVAADGIISAAGADAVSAEAGEENGQLTKKTLRATRSGSSQTIYWNPGPSFDAGEYIVQAGSDTDYDGLNPRYPVESWEEAVYLAKGGTVVLMCDLDLGASDAEDYLMKEGGDFKLSSKNVRNPENDELPDAVVKLRIWENKSGNSIIVNAGQTLILEDVILDALIIDGKPSGSQVITCKRGDILIRSNVTAENGYIQIEAFKDLKHHPVRVTSADSDLGDGMITLQFTGINSDPGYRYTDVVVPADDLKAEADSGETNAEAVGLRLNQRFQLHKNNRKEGNSQYDWYLAQDTEYDKDGKYRQNLELYFDIYYNAVYLDGKRGNDDNEGFHCMYPVRTWKRAVEIWEMEMNRSLDVRTLKYDGGNGESEESIKAQYPVPDTIYICGTVTIDDQVDNPQVWELPAISKVDYNGELVKTEVMSHSHNSPDPYDPYYHSVPDVLIHVTGTQSLTLKNLTLRNTTNLSDLPEFPSNSTMYGTTESVTVKVDDHASFQLAGNAVLTGGLANVEGDLMASRGTHVKLLDSATFVMSAGTIEKRQQGVIARGKDVTFTMTGGEIRENNNYYNRDENRSRGLYGSGVSLQDGVTFTMRGGSIIKNSAYPSGAGVYVKADTTGSGKATTFLLKSGNVVENIGHSYIYSSSDISYGSGMYGEKGTLIEIGTDSAAEGDALVGKNTTLWGDGIGIWTDGDLILNHATISENYRAMTNEWDNNYTRYGVGIYVGKNGWLNMKDSWIKDNHTEKGRYSGSSYMLNALGVGVYLEDNGTLSIDDARTHTISGSIFSGNTVREHTAGYSGGSRSYNSGGGVYFKGKLKIDNSSFTDNRVGNGGGIFGYSSTSEVVIRNTTFDNNQVYTSDDGGGAIYSEGKVTLLDKTKIINNKSGRNGGGIYMNGGILRAEGTETDNIIVSNNSASYGGGIHSRGTVQGYYLTVDHNTSYSGGGMQLEGTSYLRNVVIADNHASSTGGGLYLNGSQYLTDCEVIRNTTRITSGEETGGGIYVYSGNTYLTEDTDGAFVWSDNHSTYGGAAYVYSGTLYINIAGDINNSAEKNGSNLYMLSGNSVIANGSFKLPDPDIEADGVYNFFIASGRSLFGIQIDLQKVEIEKKTTGKAEAIYINAASGIISLLTTPPNNNRAELPLDLNMDTFVNGSVVVKPAALESVSYPKVNHDATGIVADQEDYTKLTDVGDYADYFKDGQLPRRTILGKMGVNIGLLGEGVYLSGSGIDAPGRGLSPETPVLTFEYAKDVLEKEIIAASQNGSDTDGFVPFIYICGSSVMITSDEIWELDERDPLFKTVNAKYIETEMREEQCSEAEVPIAQVRRYSPYTNGSMIHVKGASGNTVTFQTNRIYINGMASNASGTSSSYPLIEVSKDATAILTGDSRVANSFNLGVQVNDDGILQLTGQEGEINTQLVENHHYNVILARRATLIMDGYSSILSNIASGDRLNSYTKVGVSTNGPDSKIYMNDYSSITGQKGCWGAYGVELRGTGSSMLMADDSFMDVISTAIIIGEGVKVDITEDAWLRPGTGISGSPSVLSTVTMSDNAKIIKAQTGAYLNGIVTFHMKDNAQMVDTKYGINAERHSTDINIIMEDNTKLLGLNETYQETTNSSYHYGEQYGGIQIHDGASGAYKPGKVAITLSGSAQISYFETGIFFYRCDKEVTIVMKDQSSIEQNRKNGVGESDYGDYYFGTNYIDLTMQDDARISGNPMHGIYLASKKTTPAIGWKRITMEGKSIIGAPITDGNGYYDAADGQSGNLGYGIYASAPIELAMKANAKISGNGLDGVHLTRGSTGYTGGTGTVLMSGMSSICDNKGSGMNIPTTDRRWYPNICEVTLDGTASGDTPSITGNGQPIYLGTDSKLKLVGTASLGESTATADLRSMDCFGKLELDGRSTVGGFIYLKTLEHPIIMTHKVEASSPQKYKLWMVEAFMGANVVEPVNLDGTGSGIDDVSDQLGYFEKVGADGLAADKILRVKNKCIILGGDNNIYISGDGFGDDIRNDGRTPSTPVRTFAKAKSLLQTGEFYPGANIVVCNKTVNILAGDENWSFDPGGSVTNNGETWKPLVLRYDEFKGKMLSVNYSSLNVNFEHITIDGGSEKGLTANASSEVLLVDGGATVTLGEGAVLQNNKSSLLYYGGAVGVYINNGLFVLDGGTIQNMVQVYENIYSPSGSNPAASAIYAGRTIDPSGGVIIKSGLIAGNVLDLPNISTPRYAFGTVVIAEGKTLEMSGGVIENNEVITTVRPGNSESVKDGNLVIYRGRAEISGGIIRNNQSVRGSAIGYYIQGEEFSRNTTLADGGLIISGGQIYGNTTIVDGQRPTESYSPLYIHGRDFQLKGNSADIQDNIFLASPDSIIKISQRLLFANRVYHVYLQESNVANYTYSFKKGHVVAQPDGNIETDVTPYYPNLDVHTTKYILDYGRTELNIDRGTQAGAVPGVKENSCLILMKPVYLDSAGTIARPLGGSDDNPGTSPSKAVATFTKAKQVGSASDGVGGTKTGYEDYYIIYISGPAVNTKAETEWQLPATAYMCRYTGFPFYEGDAVTHRTEPAYFGPLIKPQETNAATKEFVFDGIAVYGRRVFDKLSNNGESIVQIENGVNVTVNDTVTGTTIFERNHNMGTYTDSEGREATVNGNGGVFRVDAGGGLTITGGNFNDTSAVNGSSIYLGSDENNVLAAGTLYLTGTPVISGTVYLHGDGIRSAYIETDKAYVPATALGVDVFDDYHTRSVIWYKDTPAVTPGIAEMKYFTFSDAIRSSYEIVNDSNNSSIMMLYQRRVIYLDGVEGSDDITHDGSTPETAFKTLGRVFEAIGNNSNTNGTLVYVVNTVTINRGETILNNYYINNNVTNTRAYGGSFYSNDYNGTVVNHTITGEVIFKRYAQPKDYDPGSDEFTGFNKPTLKDTLFLVTQDMVPGDPDDNARLSLNGIYVDGHSLANSSADVKIKADAVKASAPLITVENGARLTCNVGRGGSESSPTRIVHNVNQISSNPAKPGKEVGTMLNMQGNPETIYEGSSAGIEIIVGEGNAAGPGICFLDMTEFSDLTLEGDYNFGGTDVYSNGKLQLQNVTHFTGTVYLEGLGSSEDAASQATSRYIEVMKYGSPVKTDFQVLMRDKYDGRPVAWYIPGNTSHLPAGSDLGYYRLEERIKDYFSLGERSGQEWVLELQIPKAVYIDGTGGVDNLSDPMAGSTPENPVKNLWRAYQLLYTRGGNTIYVVNNPIEIESGSYVEVTGTSYVDVNYKVFLPTTSNVWITRYMKPDFTKNALPEVVSGDFSTNDYEGVLMHVGSDAEIFLKSNVHFDGHRKAKTIIGLAGHTFNAPKELYVSREGTAKAPLIQVASDGVLNLNDQVSLINNHNTYDAATDPAGLDGGAIYNQGTVTTQDEVLFAENEAAFGGVFYNLGSVVVDGAEFAGNVAGTWVNDDGYTAVGGSAAYQGGDFTIQGDPDKLKGHNFYLTTEKLGADAGGNTIWGREHILQINERLLPDADKTAGTDPFYFVVDMDHAVSGRDVIKFTDPQAYDYKDDADAEYDHFNIYGSVPRRLFLVAALPQGDKDILELRDWQVLDVDVPDNIYLAFVRKGSDADAFDVKGIGSDAAGDGLFKDPDYRIINHGHMEVDVYIRGLENDNENDGLNDPAESALIVPPVGAPISPLFSQMTLMPDQDSPAAATDLYLAVKAADTTETNPFKAELGNAEVSLDYFEMTADPTPHKLGTLAAAPETGARAESIGTFSFVAKGGTGFIDAYADSALSVTGVSIEAAQKWMDGTGGEGVNARAKYLLKYKLWVPDRQDLYKD